MRAFVAIDLPGEVRSAVSRAQAEFRAAAGPAPRQGGVRWTRPEGIHLTLKFLGEVPNGRLTAVEAALAALPAFDSFRIEVTGLGFFPTATRPRVFWLGLAAPRALADLADRIEAALEPLGFPREKRAFRPHLTLARFNGTAVPPSLADRAREQQDAAFGTFLVSSFFLFESKLKPGGAEYRKIMSFPRPPSSA